MTSTLVVLLRDSTNRVYARTAETLALAEIAILAPGARAEATHFAGIPAVVAHGVADADRLANASGAYGMFALEGGLLRPLDAAPTRRYDDDLLTIQKYPGKTNEQFTKLVLNIILAFGAFADVAFSERLHVLDPMCGRGTTLNVGLLAGHDVTGIEIEGRDFDAYAAFLRRWLTDKRLKHTTSRGTARVPGRATRRVFEASLAPTKTDERQRLTFVNDDTCFAAESVRAGTVHGIVVDLPYGVQHRSAVRGARDAPARSRSPLPLLGAALPGWLRALKPGGSLGIAWNTHLASRADLADVLTGFGLELAVADPYLALAHRVDASIERDVMVARKRSGE